MLVNAGQTLTERAKISAGMEAIVDGSTGARYDFREYNARSNQLAHALLALGLATGDRVACLMANQPRYAEAYFACAKAGYVFVALNWRLTTAELSYQLLDAGVAAVVHGADQLPLVDSLRAQFPNVGWLDAEHGDFDAAIRAAAATEPPIGASGEDPLLMMYTSGTTGRPKGALMSHRASLANLASMLATSDLNSNERQIVVAPMFHIGGLGMTMIAVYRGMTSVLLKAFEPALMWQTIERERITGFFGVPARLASMHQ
ncbi:MAG: AMP-binding protein, partial [Steroidobacteraceae bacterium]